MTAPATSAVRPAPKGILTLRALFDQRKAKGERFRLAEVVGIVVPICTDLAQRHARGETPWVHAGAIGAGADGLPRLIPDLARNRPSDPRDAAAIAPELARSAPTPRSSVFALGALVYEMLTLQPIGPGMKPPTQVVVGIPAMVDTILAKALVTDPAQRPDDLSAFAQAIHHFAPASIAPPPAADESAFEVDIDLRSSMLPPPGMDLNAVSIPRAPRIVDLDPMSPAAPISQRNGGNQDPFASVVDMRHSQPESDPQRVSANRALDELSQLKARLEADPTPRWMMVKDKMDHGPFAAIELLQMIVSDRFAPDDLLVDTHTGAKMKLAEHPEFSRFAHHAALKRENVKETKAVAQAERSEKAAGAAKGTFGIIAVIAAIAVVGVVVWRIQAKRAEDEQRKARDAAMQVAGEGSIKGQTVATKPKFAGGGGGGGGYGGKSYDDALKNTVSGNDEEGISMSECSAVGGGVAAGCGLSGSATAKFVVQAGHVKGVSVSTDPPQPGVESCMKGAIGGMSFRNMPAATGCIRTFKVH
ncbi:MAG: hypothetical protein NVS3B10_15130 [Polyangiales bacterium]